MVRRIDVQEKEIIRQLIMDARLSDNQITKNSGIPLKTVNRKRKKLEEEGLLSYFTYLSTGKDGTGEFTSRQLYTITLQPGITRESFLSRGINFNGLLTKHILESHLGERDGKLVLVMIIESFQSDDILEIINAEVIPLLRRQLGNECVTGVESIRLTKMFNLLHNYQPSKSGQYLANEQQIFIVDNKGM